MGQRLSRIVHLPEKTLMSSEDLIWGSVVILAGAGRQWGWSSVRGGVKSSSY